MNIILIDGVLYQVVSSENTNPFERLEDIKPLQAIRMYDKYMYRTPSGEARACYVNNTSNNWGI